MPLDQHADIVRCNLTEHAVATRPRRDGPRIVTAANKYDPNAIDRYVHDAG
jgi:hypothetical protein